MRLMQILGSDKRGGAEAFFSRLCIALGETDLTQQVVIRHGADDCRDELRAAGIEPIELPFLFSADMLTKFRLGRLTARFAPDVVMTWMSRASANCPSGPFVRVARLGGYYDLKYFAGSDHLIGNTLDIVDYLIANGWPRERAWYLPNFVDESPSPTTVARADLGTPAGTPVILALGRLHSDKAFDVMLKAMPDIPDAHLWLAGEGPLDAELKALAAELKVADRVRFLGWRRDMGALMDAADIVAYPSRIEPLGNGILEAWVHRRPVVAAASKGPAALIDHGRTGLVVPLEDHVGLAGAIREVIADAELAAGLVAGGHAHYQANFSRKAVVGQYLDFFAKVAR